MKQKCDQCDRTARFQNILFVASPQPHYLCKKDYDYHLSYPPEEGISWVKLPEPFSWFPKSAKAKLILGAWWIFEPIMIETPLFYYITTPFEQQILGPWNIVYFLSSLLAVVYGTICLGFGYAQWNREHFAKKPL